MAYTYSKIATYTVGSGGVATVSFLNIPQTYTDLVLLSSTRTGGASTSGNFYININNSDSSFSMRRIYGTGSGTGSDTGTTWAAFTTANNATASTFDNNTIYFPNYTSSNYKSYSIDTVQEHNASTAFSGLGAGLWSNTSTITSFKFTPDSGNFLQYSTFHLYGIKAEL